MSNNILFIFEGARTENNFVESMEKNILSSGTFIKCSFCTDIYQLYREIATDDDIDTFSLIKELNEENRNLLKSYKRDDFSEIYLFFDYDGHSCLASSCNKKGESVTPGDEKISDLLSFFNNETEKGKLYVSYPMIEAIRHLPENFESFKDIAVRCKGKNCKQFNGCSDNEKCRTEISNYKQTVTLTSIPYLSSVNGYKLETWKYIIKSHLFKLNYIVNDKFELPDSIEAQTTIFQMQLSKYINQDCPIVSVLGSFPIFIYDYFGHKKTLEILES